MIFARGRLEPVGAGQIGNTFAGALRQKSGKNVNLYAVQYPADNQIDVGANDMSRRVQSTAASCPDTRIVLGGYSLGAAVTDVVLAMPFAFFGFDNPLPPRHGAAHRRRRPVRQRHPVGGADRELQPASIATGPSSCVTATTRSATRPSPTTGRTYLPDHLAPAYIKAGMANQAADFVAGRLAPPPPQ